MEYKDEHEYRPPGPPAEAQVDTESEKEVTFFDSFSPSKLTASPNTDPVSGLTAATAAGAADGALAQTGNPRTPGRTNTSHDREPLGRVARLQRVDRGTFDKSAFRR